MKKIKESRWYDKLVEVLEKEFPKGRCSERGQALVLLAYAEMMFQEAEEEIKKATQKRSGKE